MLAGDGRWRWAIARERAVVSDRSRRPVVGRGGYCPGRERRAALSEVHMSAVEAHITGTVWKIECAVGDQIEEGDTVAILESMKMEMPVEAEDSGTVAKICCEEGQSVSEGDTLVVLE
jgi:acetyl-CoA carboxylase biotin carboxyl carrier protein